MKKKEIYILSFLYTIFMIIGTSFIISNSFNTIVKHPFLTIIFSIILYLVFFNIIDYLFELLDKYKSKKKKLNKALQLFDKHPIIISSIILLICWLPYIIAFYPTILNPDSIFQIKQYFGIDNKYSYYINLIDPNQIITNHHPVIHTLLLGSCVKLGVNIGNANLGFFLYSIIQITIFITTLSITIWYLKKLNINIHYRIIILLLYSLIPVFPFYAMTAVKDVIYTCLCIIYTILLHNIIKNNMTIKKAIYLIIISIFLFLFRNNGIYIVVLSLPLLLIKNKKWLQVLIVLLVTISLYKTYDKVILPYFKITPTSIRETLSIPFQQTARYVKYHGNEISEKDKKIINKILKYNSLSKKYDPELSDPVKNTFNKDYSKKDIKKYFSVWYKGLKKHPFTYIEATINNTYGYVYPVKTKWYLYYKYDNRLLEDNINYHYNNLKLLRIQLITTGVIFPYIPIIGLLTNIGMNTWAILFIFFYLLHRKKYKDIIWLLPSIITILVCFASPANTYYRYALPYIFSMPLIIGLLFNTIKEK